ncbi:MAG: hypothetical protein QGH74_03940 [Candidatus Brocadiia bacterium]|nr:hypothetical protein [Candidatus Brocadiia bacterium]
MSGGRADLKPLIQWTEHGDPDLVPVVMASGQSTAASYFGVPVRTEGKSASFTEVPESPVTPEMVLRCSRETGIHVAPGLGYSTALVAIEFMDDVEMIVREEPCSEGLRRFTTIRTPKGELSDVFITPVGKPACWEEHLVSTAEDLPAFEYLIEEAARASAEDDRVREKVTASFRAQAEKWPAEVALSAIMAVPTFALTCNLYMDTTAAFYLMADHAPLLDRLFEAEERRNAVVIACAAEAGADYIRGAINGLELYSPTIYERYFIPQARTMHEQAHALGLRAWVHTCGHMHRLIQAGTYEAMDVDVLESLSHPPLGDVDELGEDRARLGTSIATRGGVNVSLFYEPDLDGVRARTREVAEQTRGYRHMIGDTNDSFPPYPRENILAAVDELDKMGVLLRA